MKKGSIRSWFLVQTAREKIRFTLITGLIIMGMLCSWFAAHRFVTGVLRERIQRINTLRKTTARLIARTARIQESRQAIDTLLSADPSFKIADYFGTLIQKQGLREYVRQQPTIKEEKLTSGYTQVNLAALLIGLDMQQVSLLLLAIEQNARVFAKEIVITRSSKDQTVDLTLVIATINPAQNPS
jgi:hypothetical protein